MKKHTKKRGVPCFTRWSRKSYGIFSSLGREVKIGVLTVGMSILTLTSETALAQADTTETVQKISLEEIKVVVQKTNPTRGVVTPIEVYNRKNLSTSPLQTIESALKVNPAVDLRERGSKGVQADISIFGGSFDQTMIMLNGVNLTDAQTGHHSHLLPVDIEAVSEINLIGGVSGIGAYAGALNFVTAPLKPNYLRAEISGGQHGYLYTNLSAAATKNNLSAMAMASMRRSKGYAPNTDFNTKKFFTRVNYDSQKAGFFDFQAGYQHKYFGANGFYSLKYPNQAEELETFLASARWLKNIGKDINLNAILCYRKNFDRFELFRDGANAAEWYTNPNFGKTDNIYSEFSADYSWRYGKTSLGADHTFSHIYSTVLGEGISNPKPVTGRPGVFYTKGKTRNVINGWLRHVAEFDNLKLSGTINFAHHEGGNNVMWSLASEYKINSDWLVFANATQSMRLPSFTDLYYTTLTHEGNALLKPERAQTYRVGASYTTGKFVARANVYYRKGKDVIDWVLKTNDPDAKWKATRIPVLDTYGAEVYAAYVSKGFVRELSAGYGYITTKEYDNEYYSKYMLDYLNHKLSLRAKMQLCSSVSLDVIATYFNRNGIYEDVAGNKIKYGNHWLVDARLNWQKDIFTIYLDATNIFGTKYFDFGGMPQPQRWINAGFVITI